MEKITEILDKRHKERRTRLDNIQEIKNKETSANEGIEYFESAFDEKVREIQNNLSNLEIGDTNLPSTFCKIGQSLQELQKFLSSSTFFLNDRKVQKCQEILNDLSNRLEERKSNLIPKKKFGFKNRPKEPQRKAEDFVDSIENPKHTACVLGYTISNRENATITLTADETNEKDISIVGLKNCVVHVIGHPGSLHLKDIGNCIIVCGPISRSVFGETCCQSVFAFACQQLRLHNSFQCDIYLHVTSRGIIEDTSQIRVAPYNVVYTNIEADFVAAGISHDKNYWQDLADFNWLSTEQTSPNWAPMLLKDRINDWKMYINNFILNLQKLNIVVTK